MVGGNLLLIASCAREDLRGLPADIWTSPQWSQTPPSSQSERHNMIGWGRPSTGMAAGQTNSELSCRLLCRWCQISWKAIFNLHLVMEVHIEEHIGANSNEIWLLWHFELDFPAVKFNLSTFNVKNITKKQTISIWNGRFGCVITGRAHAYFFLYLLFIFDESDFRLPAFLHRVEVQFKEQSK